MVFWEGYVSDEVMSTFAPIVVYWLYAGVFQLLSRLDNYRLYTRTEEDERNLVSLSSVIKGVLLQQLVYAVVSYLVLLVTSDTNDLARTKIQPPFIVQILQMIVAMFVIDIWQYFVHRYMHTNKFLYRHIHSQHHKLVVPYALGASYNHPLEGLLDTVGGAIAFLVSGMTARTAVIFFCFAAIKNIDDHCGLRIPGNPLHMIFENNTAYHDIHHQLPRYNFSQPFFVIWDKLLGTYMPVKRPDQGGLEAKLSKD